MNKMELEFLEFSKNLTGQVAVGFSGGSDSTAILYLAKKFINNFDVIYFSHGDNPLVDDDKVAIDFCKNQCQMLGLTLKVIELDLEKTKAGWEASGHKARKQYAMEHYDAFLLGHHLDDVCENYFIQFFRGSGSAKVLKSEKTMKRPLLKYSKEEIKHYLRKKKIQWLEDKTNENTDITRNYWRKKVLPIIEEHYPQYRNRMASAIALEQQNQSLLKELAVIDGLYNFVNEDKIKVPKQLSSNRMKNLIYFYCKEKYISAQRPTIEEFVKQITRPQKMIETAFLDKKVIIEKADESICINFFDKPKFKP